VTDPRDQYEQWHARLDVDTESDAPWHRLVKRYLSRHDLRGKRVLEIGCGRGGFAAWLSTRCPSLHGADFSYTAVAKASGFVRSATFEVADIQSLPHPGGTFDAAVSCETIEHVLDPARALSELARVLKPGGLLFLTTPNYLGTMGLYRAYLRLTRRRYTEEGQPINRLLMLPWTIRLARAAGLTIERVDGIGHYLPFPGRPPIEFPILDSLRPLMKWAALHSLVLARKP
jgi:ubiquinone/menaquinone biosynthesis C-methylase UbiE